jgi:hypothetical protein
VPVEQVLLSGAAKQISTALTSAMESPSKEIGNYIADKIRYLRYNSLLSIVKKADEKARKKGMHLKMPAIKFFVPFCEAASLENAEESNELRDIWANLLLGASSRDDADSLLYLKILQQIGTREVKFLRDLMENGRATTFAMMISSFHAEENAEFDERGLDSLFAALPDGFELDYLADLIVDCAECPGILFDEVCVLVNEEGEIGQICANFDHDVERERIPPARILMSLGLVEKLKIRSYPISGCEVPSYLSIDGYRITAAGEAFYKACSDSKFQKKFKRKFDYKDYDSGFMKWLRSQKRREKKHGPRENPGWAREIVRAIIKGGLG